MGEHLDVQLYIVELLDLVCQGKYISLLSVGDCCLRLFSSINAIIADFRCLSVYELKSGMPFDMS